MNVGRALSRELSRVSRLSAGAQLQEGITPRSALAAGRNKRRGPGRENRGAVVSSPTGRPAFQRRPTLNYPYRERSLSKKARCSGRDGQSRRGDGQAAAELQAPGLSVIVRFCLSSSVFVRQTFFSKGTVPRAGRFDAPSGGKNFLFSRFPS